MATHAEHVKFNAKLFTANVRSVGVLFQFELYEHV